MIIIILIIIINISVNDGRVPKDIMYGEMVLSHHLVVRPTLCFKDVSKRGLKHRGINSGSWEKLTHDHSDWLHVVQGSHIDCEKGETNCWE